RIGQSLASYALGCGMHVKAVDMFTETREITVNIGNDMEVSVNITPVSDLNSVIAEADYISLHVPKQADGSAVISKAEFAKMKKGVLLVNAARGGVINEDDLLVALNEGQVSYIALDV